MRQDNLRLFVRRKRCGLEGAIEPRAQRALFPRAGNPFGIIRLGVEDVFRQEQQLSFRAINLKHAPLYGFGDIRCLRVLAKKHGVAHIDALALEPCGIA